MKKNRGFTLIELIVVIVILGIIAIVAAPKFINLQDDGHTARAKAAFAEFTSGVNLYHAAWLTQGEPKVTSGDGVIYSDITIYPSSEGFPVGTTYRQPLPGNSGISGDGCGELLTSLITTDLKIERYATTIFPTEADIKYWYNSSNECTYYYTSNMSDNNSPGYSMTYSVLTGDTHIKYTPFPK